MKLNVKEVKEERFKSMKEFRKAKLILWGMWLFTYLAGSLLLIIPKSPDYFITFQFVMVLSLFAFLPVSAGLNETYSERTKDL